MVPGRGAGVQTSGKAIILIVEHEPLEDCVGEHVFEPLIPLEKYHDNLSATSELQGIN
jgi:hypothetical protein